MAKITQYPIFVNPKNKQYYWLRKCVCEACNNEIPALDTVVLISSWSKRNSFNTAICINCYQRKKYLQQEVEELKVAIVVENKPVSCVPVVAQPPILISGDKDRSVFDVANEQIGDEAVNDNTRLAGRESLEGASIGLSPDNIESKDQILNDAELDSFLLDVKNSVPVLPNEDKKRLENDSDKKK